MHLWNPGEKRGLPTGYVRGIEALLGLFQQFLPNGEYTLRKILRENIAGRIVDSEYLDNASDIWRSSDLAKDFDQLLSSVDNNIGSRLTSETIQLPELRNAETIIHQRPGDPNLFERLQHCANLPPGLPAKYSRDSGLLFSDHPLLVSDRGASHDPKGPLPRRHRQWPGP